MKKIIFIFLVAFLLIPLLLFVHPQTVVGGKNATLPQNQVINENYFTAGSNVIVSGTVNGDAYVAGGNVVFDGEVNGDLFVAGGNVTIAGVINGNVRAAGGQIHVTGKILGNATIVGGSITVVNNTTIGKSLVAAGGQLIIMAPVGTSATLAGGSVTVGNTVKGNLLAVGNQITLSPQAHIAGSMTYYSEKQADIQSGAVVKGGVNFHKTQYSAKIQKNAESARAFGMVFRVIGLITAFIIGSLFILLFPRFMQKATDQLSESPWKTLLAGFGMLVLAPVVMVLLFVTLIGIPFALLLLVGYVIYIYVAQIFAGLFIGQKITEGFKLSQSQYLSLLIGLVAIALVSWVPVLGSLVGFFVLIGGMGALLLTKLTFFKLLRSKNIL